MEQLNEFLSNHFKGLNLRPPLFYLWKYGLRFEIRNPDFYWYDACNELQMRNRTSTLFKAVFDNLDNILWVADLTCDEKDQTLLKKPIHLRKFLKDKNLLSKLQYTKIPCVFEDDEDFCENAVTHRFSLLCHKAELNHSKIFEKISTESFYEKCHESVYFINLTKKLIFHFYGDGCDVISEDKESSRFLYEDFNDWILDYDRTKIELLYK